MNPIESVQSTLDNIEEKGVGLTDWEANFLDDMLRMTDRGECPSQRQRETIDRIHEQRVPSGS